MKNHNIFFLIFCSFAAQAQITQYTDLTKQSFYGIGGYSYTEQNFPAGVQATPYIRMGPSPQNDFMYAATAIGGIKNLNNAISTSNTGATITLKMKNNNVRKFGANVLSKTPDGLSTTTNAMILSVFTNQGNGQTYIFSNSSITWMGLVATGQNEYIDSVKVSYASASTNVITIGDIMVGDNQAQNVALNFDGVDDFVSIPNAIGNFDYNQAFTVTCWVKPDAAQPGGSLDVAILEKWDQTGPYPFVIRYLKGADAGKVRVARYDGLNNPAINSTALINDGLWHHIALTTPGSGGLMKLYIDGNLQAQINDNANTTTTNTSQLYIGQRGNGINRYKGEIDEVRIWNIAKTQTDIQNERFCKNPNTTNLQAAYNFNNGVPNGNNSFLTQIPDAAGIGTHGTLNNFTKTDDASNFVMGQVKYVKNDATGSNNGSSWANAFTNLQSALPPNSCNDLFEVYVAKGNSSYKPALSNVNTTFTIPSDMKIYGGFAGTEKNINERNMALIHTTNKTTLSGDLLGNDNLFNFFSNRTDNSLTVVFINGGYVILDGFTVRGGYNRGIYKYAFGDITISNCRMVDNEIGLHLYLANSTVSNCTMAGNNTHGVYIATNSSNFSNCLIANNGGDGIFYENGSPTSSVQSNLINCTIAANRSNGIESTTANEPFSVINHNFKNTIIKDNAGGIVDNGGGSTNYVINYSLLQGGITLGTGNLDFNTNPQFVSPLANTVISDLGDYRLKDSSPCINVGTDVGVSPHDLDRKPRPKGGKTDMGAYESNVNMNEIISIVNGNWESNSTWNLDRVPLTSDNVILNNNHVITITTPNAVAKNLEQRTNAQIIFNALAGLRLGL